VLNEDLLEDGEINSFNDIAQNAPNFTFFTAGENRSTSFYSIRGISNFNLSTRDAVGFFVDDIPYDFTGFIGLDLIDLERVEVLRGPQNTLYGRSSLGGVVNVITRRPTNEFEFIGSTSYGSFNDFETQLSVSGPVSEDELFFRLAGSYGSQDGYVENTLLDEDIGGGTTFTGRGKLLWTPSEDWEISFNASFHDYREGAVAYVPVDNDPFEAQLDFNGFNDLVANAQSLKVTYTNADFRATTITTRRFSDQDGQLDADYSPADILINTTDFDSTVWTQEIRFQSPENTEQFEWLVGGYFETSDFSEDRPFINGVDSEMPGIEQIDGEFENRTLAIFGQGSYRPIEALTLTAGLRYESTNGKIELFENTFFPEVGDPVTNLSIRDLEVEGSELLPRFVAQYRFNTGIMTYGSITRGYRPPGPNFNPFNEATAIFEGERSWNYEVGVKSQWFNDRLAVNFALFHSPIENFQFPSFGPGGDFIIDTADASTTGAELELIATPVTGLDIIAGLGLLSAEFRSGISPFTGESLEGNMLPYAPKLTYNLAVQYRSLEGILGRVELTGFGTTYFDDINTVERDPFVLVNARLGYEFSEYGVYFFVNNIFDEEYVTQAFDSFSDVGVVGTFGLPRTYGIQLKARF
jgi:iron complex outermembrane receptor protein